MIFFSTRKDKPPKSRGQQGAGSRRFPREGGWKPKAPKRRGLGAESSQEQGAGSRKLTRAGGWKPKAPKNRVQEAEGSQEQGAGSRRLPRAEGWKPKAQGAGVWKPKSPRRRGRAPTAVDRSRGAGVLHRNGCCFSIFFSAIFAPNPPST